MIYCGPGGSTQAAVVPGPSFGVRTITSTGGPVEGVGTGCGHHHDDSALFGFLPVGGLIRCPILVSHAYDHVCLFRACHGLVPTSRAYFHKIRCLCVGVTVYYVPQANSIGIDSVTCQTPQRHAAMWAS